MDQIDTITYNNVIIPIYGTDKTPLFNANLIIVQLLQYSDVNQCKFYRNNKDDDKYVIKHKNIPEVNSPLAQKGNTNQYSGTTLYLTEIGLYECIFQSKKTFAQEFRFSIVNLLHDIRTNKTKLLFTEQSQLIQQLQDKHDFVGDFVLKESDYKKQIDDYKYRLTKCTSRQYIYQITVISSGKVYIGITLNPCGRIRDHRGGSCNKYLKLAFKNKEDIKAVVIGMMICSNREEEKYLERTFIDQIPLNMRFNIMLPTVLDYNALLTGFAEKVQQIAQTHTNILMDNISEQYEYDIYQQLEPVLSQQEEVKQPIMQDQEEGKQSIIQDQEEVKQTNKYDILYEQQLILETPSEFADYISNDQDSVFKDKIKEISKFYKDNNIYPRDSPKISKEERVLGQVCVKLRNAYRTQSMNNYKLTNSRFMYIKHIIPEFFDNTDGLQVFKRKIIALKAFMTSNNNKYPQQAETVSKQEKQMFDFVMHVKADHNTGELPEERKQLVLSIIPDFIFKSDATMKFNRKLEKLQQFYQQHQRLPKQKEDKMMNEFVRNIRQSHQTQDLLLLTPDRKQALLNIIPSFTF